MRDVPIEKIFVFVRNGKPIKQNDGKEGYPITRIETIWNETIDPNRFGYADLYDEELEEFKKHLLQKGDILMSHINSPKHLGKCAIYEGEPDNLIHGMNLLCLRANEKTSYPKYLKYYFNSRIFKSHLPKIANQSVNQASFSAGNLKKLLIPLPPLPQQKKIAAILDAADAYRQKTKALIGKYEELTQSLFLEMFGDVADNKIFQTGCIGDLVIIVRDGPHVSPKYSERGIPILSTRNIRPYELVMDGLKYVSKEMYNELTRKFKPIKDDILLTKGGTTGFAKIVDWDWDFCIWVHLAALRPDQTKANPKYLEAVLNSHYGYYQAQRYTRGIANKDLGLKRMIKIKVPIPPLDLQNQFAVKIKTIESQKLQAQSSLKKAEDLFNSLLQRAFKGELT